MASHHDQSRTQHAESVYSPEHARTLLNQFRTALRQHDTREEHSLSLNEAFFETMVLETIILEAQNLNGFNISESEATDINVGMQRIIAYLITVATSREVNSLLRIYTPKDRSEWLLKQQNEMLVDALFLQETLKNTYPEHFNAVVGNSRNRS